MFGSDMGYLYVLTKNPGYKVPRLIFRLSGNRSDQWNEAIISNVVTYKEKVGWCLYW